MSENIKTVYMIGIGGISMSAIALQLKNMGFKVVGSDCNLSEITSRLQNEGILVKEGCAPDFVDICDVCIMTGAIGEDNEDVKRLKNLNKPIFSRAEVLGFLSSNKKCIAISGSHGKTTTTGMLATIMLEAGLDPTIHIGGKLNAINSNVHLGKGEYFLTEACEYKDSFLSLSPYISVVLNVESDHMDYFKNMDNLHNSFKQFTKNTENYGFCVVNNKISYKLFDETLNVLTFSADGNLQAKNVKEYLPGRFCYDLYIYDEYIDNIKLSAFGMHNVENSLAVIGVAILLDIDLETIKCGLLNYKGVARRMEFISDSPMIIHDYAHHPTEIKATIQTCKSINKKLVVIFQPHLYSRTQDLYDDFLNCFNQANEVWLLPIYPARENPIVGITSKQLAQDLFEKGVNSKYFDSFEDCKGAIANCCHDTLFAILGAGDIEKMANSLKKDLKYV